MKGVIYARYSSHNQTEQSIEGQVRVCEEYAKAHDIEIIKVYADRAIPGKTDNRPEFQQMIADSALGMFETIVLYNTDRFARDRYLAAVYKHELRQNGVELKYATGSIPDGPEGIILEGLMESMAEYYSAELSTKIKRGMRESASKCHTTGANPGLGFKVLPDKSFAIDEEGAEAVRLIFHRYNNGVNKQAIIDELNSKGFRTSTGRPFVINSLHRILNNERYLGYYIYKGVKTPNGMPRIISDEVWAQCQEEQKRRKRIKPKYRDRADFLLAGKAFCGHCGSQMTGISGTSHTGKKHHYYSCPKSRKKDHCAKKAVNKDFIEELIVHETIAYILRPDNIKEIAQKVCEAQKLSKTDDAIHIYQGKLNSTRQAISNLMKALETGATTKSILNRIIELEHEEEHIQQEIEDLKRSQIHFTEDQIEYMLLRFCEPHGDPESFKRDIINTFISEIYLYDDKVVLFYNLTEENELRSSERNIINASLSTRTNSNGFDNQTICSTIRVDLRTPNVHIFVFETCFALVIETPTNFS